MLELRNIVKHWQAPGAAPRVLLDGLHLQVDSGETVAILGPSGSGKSTLLKIIAGLEAADSGQVFCDGQDISALPAHLRRFALMFQDFALFPHLNVQDNVAFGLVEQGHSRSQARAQAQTMLQRFGMAEHALGRVWQLSGGEQQRVALARALITRPRVLLLDEPFSALDAPLRASLRAEFAQHLASTPMAVLWVTHDEAEARAVGARGLELVEGVLQRRW
jgi:ABC-type branched-subunit amino acid transport system ATPase component